MHEKEDPLLSRLRPVNGMWRGALCVALGWISSVGPAAAARRVDPIPHYAVVTALGGDLDVRGWDYATIDSTNHRLYLSADGVLVVDLASGKITRNFLPALTGKNTHGIVTLADSSAAIADATDGEVVFFDTRRGEVTGRVATGPSPTRNGWHNPDALISEPKTGLLIAVDGDSGELVLINPARKAVVGRIAIGGKLEFAAANGAGLLYVNVASRDEVAAVDIVARKLVRRMRLRGCQDPTGLAYDSKYKVVLSVCDNGQLHVVSALNGAERAILRVGPGSDGVMYDAVHHVAFSASPDRGILSVIAVGPRHSEVIQTLKTQVGTRLGAFDPSNDRLYLPAATFGPPAPPLHLPGLPPLPGVNPATFKFLVVAPSDSDP
jgi:DNA-binding beta-propeller fold protein YncE